MAVRDDYCNRYCVIHGDLSHVNVQYNDINVMWVPRYMREWSKYLKYIMDGRDNFIYCTATSNLPSKYKGNFTVNIIARYVTNWQLW